MDDSEHLVVDDLHKSMGAVKALAGVSFTVPRGTVHGIIGHNGSGKSTLVKILAGVLQADRGSYQLVDADRREAGAARAPVVATVFQDLGLAENLPVLDNLLANSFQRNRLGYLDIKQERSRAKRVLATVGLDLPLYTEVRKLPEPERVMLCVARAMMRAGVASPAIAGAAEAGVPSADLLIMDEPTSSLPREELERFRDLVRRLRDDTRLTTLVVTHNPSDIRSFCDDFTALKNGRVICTQDAKEVTTSRLAELMAGQPAVPGESAGTEQPARSAAGSCRGRQVFVVEDLVAPRLSAPITLSAAEGELLGITGLEGSGFREFIGAAMGVAELTSGRILVEGEPLSRGPAGLRQAGAIFIPADRARTSGVPSATVYENMTIGQVDAYCRRGLIDRAKEKSAVAGMLRRLQVLPADPRRALQELSGGQQQKVVIGRALLSSAKVLVFEEPTLAVDVGAREAILNYLHETARAGCVVIVASGEFEWMPASCDRVVVFRSGGVAGELTPPDIGQEAILRLAYGD